MGENHERNQLIHERLIESLEEAGYTVTSAEANIITGFIMGSESEDAEGFKRLVERAKTQINTIRNKG